MSEDQDMRTALEIAAVIDGYLTAMEIEHRTTAGDHRIRATFRQDDETLNLFVACFPDNVLLMTPQLVQVPRGRRHVLLRLLERAWDTYMPRYELDRSDGELRATWHIPIGDGPPRYEDFAEVLNRFARAVIAERPAIVEMIEKAGRLSGDAADRIPAAADLAALGRDLVDLAERQEIGISYVREELVERLARALSGPRQQILLVGEPGTGKSSVVYGLANWIARGDQRARTAELADRHIYECDPTSFQRSVLYAHELENKTQLVAENCIEERAILFLDKTHLAVTTGRFDDKLDRTIANLLLPFMSRNEIAMVGAVDESGHALMTKLNPEFARAFHVLHIPEPTDTETVKMIWDRMQALGGAEAGGVEFGPDVEHRVIDLADRFYRTEHRPGRALRLLDEVVTHHREQTGARRMTARTVEDAVVATTGLRAELVRSDRRMGKRAVMDELREEVVGQDGAVEAVAQVVLTYKAEMAPEGRPIATLFFAGPTGVGKTQLARSLARYLFGSEDALVRYDMSEYADAGSYAKLCGRRGNYDEPGRLVQEVNARPFSVILFDEIEKAHFSVFNVLLGVLGEGRMTDETGNTASFLNSIIILTSNVGSNLYGRSRAGFTQAPIREVHEYEVREAIEEAFAPEFVNRLNKIVCFQELSQDAIRQIARMEIAKLERRSGLARRLIELEVSDELLEELAVAGFDRKYGARAMQRAVEELVTAPVAEFLAEQPGLSEVTLQVGWDGKAVTVGAG